MSIHDTTFRDTDVRRSVHRVRDQVLGVTIGGDNYLRVHDCLWWLVAQRTGPWRDAADMMLRLGMLTRERHDEVTAP